MRIQLSALALACAIGTSLPLYSGSGLSAQTPTQQAPVFRSAAKIVPIYATVTDAQDRLVPDLTREDFEILDNTVRQDITVFEIRPSRLLPW